MAGDDIAPVPAGVKKLSDCSRPRSLNRVGRPELVGLAGKEIRVVPRSVCGGNKVLCEGKMGVGLLTAAVDSIGRVPKKEWR